jgi:hypothetical protein
MVGRSLHRQGILACYCPTSTTGRPAHLSPRAWPAQNHGPCSSEPPANLLTHLFAKLLLAGGSFIFGNIEPIEDVEFFKDRVTIARHRRNAQQFGRRRARAGDLLSAYRVGAIAEREAAQLRHVCRGEGSADRITEIHAKLFQFGAGHWAESSWHSPRGSGGFPPQRILHYQPAGKTSRGETSGIESCWGSR